MRFGVDYSKGYNITDLKLGNATFACRYLAYPTGGAPYTKFVTVNEAQDLIRNGIAIVSNWEQGGNPEAEDGLWAATTAMASHAALGAPQYRPIYFSYDRNGPLGNGGIQYYRNCCRVLGVNRVGAYGPPDVLAQLKSLGLISWLWSWSPMQSAHIVQAGTHMMGRMEVDYDYAQASDFGQWGDSFIPSLSSAASAMPGVAVPTATYTPLSSQVHQTLINTPGFYGIALAVDEAEQFPGWVDLTIATTISTPGISTPDIPVIGSQTIVPSLSVNVPDVAGIARSIGATISDNFLPFIIRSGLVLLGLALLLALVTKAIEPTLRDLAPLLLA